MRRPNRASWLLALVMLAGCGQGMFDDESDLIVLNDSACDLVVFVDGREAFRVAAGSDMTLDDVGPGRHVLEAFGAHGGLVTRRSVSLADGEDYCWILDDC